MVLRSAVFILPEWDERSIDDSINFHAIDRSFYWGVWWPVWWPAAARDRSAVVLRPTRENSNRWIKRKKFRKKKNNNVNAIEIKISGKPHLIIHYGIIRRRNAAYYLRFKVEVYWYYNTTRSVKKKIYVIFSYDV